MFAHRHEHTTLQCCVFYSVITRPRPVTPAITDHLNNLHCTDVIDQSLNQTAFTNKLTIAAMRANNLTKPLSTDYSSSIFTHVRGVNQTNEMMLPTTAGTTEPNLLEKNDSSTAGFCDGFGWSVAMIRLVPRLGLCCRSACFIASSRFHFASSPSWCAQTTSDSQVPNSWEHVFA